MKTKKITSNFQGLKLFKPIKNKLIIIIFILFIFLIFSLNFVLSVCPKTIYTPQDLRSDLRTIVFNFLSDPPSSPYYTGTAPYTQEIQDLLRFYNDVKDNPLVDDCDVIVGTTLTNIGVSTLMEKTIEFQKECSDSRDNDGDVLVDILDPGCWDSGIYDPNDNDETDTLPICSDFFDNDGDGLIDLKDSGCEDLLDDDETDVIEEDFVVDSIFDLLNLDIPNFKGYIIEYKEPALIPYMKQLEKKGFELSAITQSLNSQTSKIELYNSQIKDALLVSEGLAKNSLAANNFLEDKVLGEYKNTFAGIALDITADELDKISNMDFVKAVHLNYVVNITLMDSVPLINADDVWQLDEDGNNCIEPGTECLTGKGVTIGIIDTGVDYTHVDLGSCNFEDMAVFDTGAGIQPFFVDSTMPPPSDSDIQMLDAGYWKYFYHTWTLSVLGSDRVSVHFREVSKSSVYEHSFFLVHNNLNGDLPRRGSTFDFFKWDSSDFWVTSFSGEIIKINSVVAVHDNTDITSSGFGTFAIDKIAVGDFTMDWSSCSKIGGGYDFVHNDNDPMDDHGHGTHVAATAAGNGVLRGVAPDATIYAYKVLNSNGGGFF